LIPAPDFKSRIEIFKIHTRGMNLDESIDFNRLLSATKDSTGADIKSICTEAGMFAIREKRIYITEEDSRMAIAKIQERGGRSDAPGAIYC
jgi:ATP-dependent 26S proteasome regulatory subunit